MSVNPKVAICIGLIIVGACASRYSPVLAAVLMLGGFFLGALVIVEE